MEQFGSQITERVIGVKTVGNFEIVNISGEDMNMPSDIVKSIALDLNNNLWIGTKQGLRVLYNTQSVFDNSDVAVDQIIVEEDGLAQELFLVSFYPQSKLMVQTISGLELLILVFFMCLLMGNKPFIILQKIILHYLLITLWILL